MNSLRVWILEQAGIVLHAKAAPSDLRMVGGWLAIQRCAYTTKEKGLLLFS